MSESLGFLAWSFKDLHTYPQKMLITMVYTADLR